MASHSKVELIQSGRKMQWSTYWQRHLLSLAAIMSKRGSCIRTNSRVVSMLMHLWASLFVIAYDSLSCSLKSFQVNLQILNYQTQATLWSKDSVGVLQLGELRWHQTFFFCYLNIHFILKLFFFWNICLPSALTSKLLTCMNYCNPLNIEVNVLKVVWCAGYDQHISNSFLFLGDFESFLSVTTSSFQVNVLFRDRSVLYVCVITFRKVIESTFEQYFGDKKLLFLLYNLAQVCTQYILALSWVRRKHRVHSESGQRVHWQPTCIFSSSQISICLFKDTLVSFWTSQAPLLGLGLPLPDKWRQTCLHSHNSNTLKLKKNTENIQPFNFLVPNESAKEEKRLFDATVSDGYYKKNKTEQTCTKFRSSSKEASEFAICPILMTLFLHSGWGHVGSSKFCFWNRLIFFISSFIEVTSPW